MKKKYSRKEFLAAGAAEVVALSASTVDQQPKAFADDALSAA